MGLALLEHLFHTRGIRGMKRASSCKRRKATKQWPRKVTVGRESVTVYRRTMPNGKPGFLVANYAEGSRRFDSYPREDLALEAASTLAKRMSEREVIAAAMTNGQAAEYAAAVQKLSPLNIGLLEAAQRQGTHCAVEHAKGLARLERPTSIGVQGRHALTRLAFA